MPEIPRRLPPTPAERLNVVVSKMAGGSSAGATRWAQPVTTADSYQPATAQTPAATPATGPLLAVMMGGQSVSFPDDGTGAGMFFDMPLSLAGLMPGRIYLVEAVTFASTDGNPGSTSIRLQYTGPQLDNGSSQKYVNTGPGQALATNIYDPYVMAVTDPVVAITACYVQWNMGVAYGADPAGSALTLQAAGTDPNINGLVQPSSFIRATDIGPVPQIS